jgi:hypothetical protein
MAVFILLPSLIGAVDGYRSHLHRLTTGRPHLLAPTALNFIGAPTQNRTEF